MDSDTKTITRIVIGLGGVLLLIAAMIGADAYLNAPVEKKKVADHNLAPTSSSSQSDLPGSQSQANANLSDASANEFGGMRSTFNPDIAYEPGEVVLSDPPKGFEDKIRARGFRVMEHVTLGRLGMTLVRVKTPAGVSVPDAIKMLARELPGITIDANTQFDPSGLGSLNMSGSNPRAMAGWDNLSPTCGRGLIIGQIDSGVDVNHPALKGQNITFRAFTKSGRKPGPADHGTSVAAMLIGTPAWGGLLPGAKLYAANMFEINEQGKKVGSAVGLLRAMDWLVGLKVNAINLSIAGGDNKVVRQAFKVAKKQNMILIAAVGNWGRSDKPAYPAAYSHVVAVTATKGAELIYSHANTGSYVDFAAPGVGIYTALPGGSGKLQSGTSFATPYITVMAAILSKAGKTPTSADLRKLLRTATKDLGKTGKDNTFGYGLVKARPACKS